MPRTVLLADDSVTAQNMGRRILTDAGYEVITVNNGSAALKKIHESHPDLIILDVYMPGYGGLEVCQRLKESGETMRIPVLLSVGKMEPFKADEAKRVRADAHIVKPFEASELLAALAKLEDRIVPRADTWGRKSKKPSFWHDDEVPAAQDEKSAADKSQETSGAVNAPKVGAFPLVPEASGELPVLADSVRPQAQAPVPQPNEVATAAPEAAGSSTVEAPALAGENAAPAQAATESYKEFAAPETPAELNGGRWIAETVALTPEEAALELEQEMRAAETQEIRIAGEADAVPTAVESNPSPVESNASAVESNASQSEGATFAAAAGASGPGSTTSAVGTASDESEPPTASEGTPAWQNWQNIRDAVMNSQNAAAIVETVAQAAKAGASGERAADASATTSQQAASATQSSSDASSSSEMEAGALASLVDSVLAELKPKLMEEIAKKLKK